MYFVYTKHINGSVTQYTVTDIVLMIAILTSSSEIRHSRPTQKSGVKKERRKRKQKLKHVDVMQISPAVHSDGWLHSPQMCSATVAVSVEGFPRWLWLHQGRIFHGNHYSRFHVLNKRDCGVGKKQRF